MIKNRIKKTISSLVVASFILGVVGCSNEKIDNKKENVKQENTEKDSSKSKRDIVLEKFEKKLKENDKNGDEIPENEIPFKENKNEIGEDGKFVKYFDHDKMEQNYKEINKENLKYSIALDDRAYRYEWGEGKFDTCIFLSNQPEQANEPSSTDIYGEILRGYSYSAKKDNEISIDLANEYVKKVLPYDIKEISSYKGSEGIKTYYSSSKGTFAVFINYPTKDNSNEVLSKDKVSGIHYFKKVI